MTSSGTEPATFQLVAYKILYEVYLKCYKYIAIFTVGKVNSPVSQVVPICSRVAGGGHRFGEIYCPYLQV
jgi:hypothetical protein